jgi:hypothetical protein
MLLGATAVVGLESTLGHKSHSGRRVAGTWRPETMLGGSRMP